MLAYLYDEDRWPSGAAGGLVTKDEQYRARCLLMTAEPCSLDEAEKADVIDSRAEGGRNGKGYLIACYDVRLDSDGYLADYKRIGKNDDAEGVNGTPISRSTPPRRGITIRPMSTLLIKRR